MDKKELSFASNQTETDHGGETVDMQKINESTCSSKQLGKIIGSKFDNQNSKREIFQTEKNAKVKILNYYHLVVMQWFHRKKNC